MAAKGTARRPGWALPPQPPETWVGGLWLSLLVVAVVVAVVVPIAPVWNGAGQDEILLADARAVAAAAAVIAAFVLLVQSTVAGDHWLRWMAGGFALAFLLHLACVGGRSDPDVLEALSMLALLAVPICALTVRLVERSLVLLVLPAVALAVVAAAAVSSGPQLLAADDLQGAARIGWAVTAGISAVAAVLWLRPAPGCRRWVGAGLAIGAVAAVVHAAASAARDDVWWAGVAGEALAVAVPAVAIGLRTVLGYGRQSRRWHQLEAEIKALRRGSRLLPDRSVTPEDDEGLPGKSEVRAILAAAAVRVALQPVIELKTGNVVGSEALSRFGGRVPTDRWFKAATKYGYGAELERLCLSAAVALLPTLPADQFLAVNISPAALADKGVQGLLTGADLTRVVVEITEHEAVENYALTRLVLGRLRTAGARIAVDDTGAGFASLRHVLMLQPDIIKLDLSLTRDVDVDRRQQALVRAVTAFSAQVGATVLAEGVETQEQLDTLREIGVRLGQGWHLGVPVLAS
ncbi:MAG: EAL domain-containing protein [Frankiaceae bacterium]|nr:EAL domain-containing protein [Frankiaceae bacterium]